MNTINRLVTAGMFGLTLASPAVVAQADRLDACLDAVKKEKAGNFVKVERLDVKGKAVYEVEVRDADGKEWEYMCDADTAKIVETEGEADDADDARFKAKMKVDLEAAKKIALDKYPGTIEEIEYEIESDGKACYEIDIVDNAGRETKVEVDADTGKIIEVSTELWEIGEEPDEKP